MSGNICDCCGRTADAGVASSGLGPISFAWCKQCIEENAEPEFMLEYVWGEIGEDVAGHVKQVKTWKDGAYIKWAEFVKAKKALIIIDESANSYYIHHNGHSVFVKEAAFFIQQGGLTEEWGKAWRQVWARDIEHARTLWT